MKKTSLREAAAEAVSGHDYENGFDLSEVWSDAARAASAAARRARAKGGNWRTAGRKEYAKRADWRGDVESRSASDMEKSGRRALDDVGKNTADTAFHDFERKSDYRRKAEFGTWSSDAAKKRYAQDRYKSAAKVRDKASQWYGAASRARQKIATGHGNPKYAQTKRSKAATRVVGRNPSRWA